MAQENTEEFVVRTEPFGGAEVVEVLNSLTGISVVDEIPYYLHVEFVDGRTGYIRKDDLPGSLRYTDLARREIGRSIETTVLERTLETDSKLKLSATTPNDGKLREVLVTPLSEFSASVEVRESADPESPVVSFLSNDKKATLQGLVDEYYKLKLPDGRDGFVIQRATRLSRSEGILSIPEPDRDFQIPTSTSPRVTREIVESNLRAQRLRAEKKPLEIHFLDVGQGDGNLIICPNGKTILIDAGTTSGEPPDPIRAYLSNEIEPFGHKIDYLIVTHPDADHYNMLDDLLYDIPIERAFYVGSRSDYNSREMYDWIRNTPTKSTRLRASSYDKPDTENSEIDCGDAKVWILAADTKASQSPKNAKSIVVLFKYGEFEAILTGDATFATEKKIRDRFDTDNWLNAELLKVGHHGSAATSTDIHWVDAVRPKTVIVSAAYRNGYGHPRKMVMEKLARTTIDVSPHPFRWAKKRRKGSGGSKYKFENFREMTKGMYNTAVNGTVVVISDGKDFEVLLDQEDDFEDE